MLSATWTQSIFFTPVLPVHTTGTAGERKPTYIGSTSSENELQPYEARRTAIVLRISSRQQSLCAVCCLARQRCCWNWTGGRKLTDCSQHVMKLSMNISLGSRATWQKTALLDLHLLWRTYFIFGCLACLVFMFTCWFWIACVDTYLMWLCGQFRRKDWALQNPTWQNKMARFNNSNFIVVLWKFGVFRNQQKWT